VKKTDARIKLPHRFDRLDARPHQLLFHLVTSILRERVEDTCFTAGPGEKRNLVNGANQRRFNFLG
jgi:hypothetical protein